MRSGSMVKPSRRLGSETSGSDGARVVWRRGRFGLRATVVAQDG